MNTTIKRLEARDFVLAVVIALALCLGVGATQAHAALTVAALAITSDGALTLNGAAASNIILGGAQVAGTIVIGGSAGTGAITLGSSTAAQTVNIANGVNADAQVVNIGDGATAAAMDIDILTGTGTAGASTLNMADNPRVTAVTLGNGANAAAMTIDIGSAAAAANRTITIGGGVPTAGTDTLDLSVGNYAKTTNIGTGTAVNTINIGTGGGADVITIGNTTAGMRYYEDIESGTGDISATAAMSGRTFLLGTAGKDVTLPVTAAATNGVVYRMVVSANVATTNMLVQGPAADASDDDIYGSVVVAGAVVLCSAEDTLTFVADTNEAIPGDWIELRSDGTNWYVSGDVSTASAFTCTDAD